MFDRAIPGGPLTCLVTRVPCITASALRSRISDSTVVLRRTSAAPNSLRGVLVSSATSTLSGLWNWLHIAFVAFETTIEHSENRDDLDCSLRLGYQRF